MREGGNTLSGVCQRMRNDDIFRVVTIEKFLKPGSDIKDSFLEGPGAGAHVWTPSSRENRYRILCCPMEGGTAVMGITAEVRGPAYSARWLVASMRERGKLSLRSARDA